MVSNTRSPARLGTGGASEIDQARLLIGSENNDTRPERQEPVIVELAGAPKGKGRPRFSRRSGAAYTPAATRSYEAELKYAAQVAMGGRVPLQGALHVEVNAMMPIPASWSRKKQRAALTGELRPTGRPDWENVAKMLDAFNQVVWQDDAQIVWGEIRKAYSDRPRLRVCVEVLP